MRSCVQFLASPIFFPHI
uniref:Uncharacterized protein n=1 Tax=Arundo donax TaxID=35708 RepID=A0A0A9BCH4_ARUDO